MSHKPEKKKRAKTPSYTQFTLKALREAGYEAEVVERWIRFAPNQANTNNPSAGFRKDMFGCIDIVAMKVGVGIVAVQSTSHGQKKPHMDKILAERRGLKWIQSGGLLFLSTWKKEAKVKRDGTIGKAMGWVPTWTKITESMYD